MKWFNKLQRYKLKKLHTTHTYTSRASNLTIVLNANGLLHATCFFTNQNLSSLFR